MSNARRPIARTLVAGLAAALLCAGLPATASAEPDPTPPAVPNSGSEGTEGATASEATEAAPGPDATPQPETDPAPPRRSETRVAAEPAALAADCSTVELASWGAPLAEVEIPEGDSACLLVTTTSAGNYAVRVTGAIGVYPYADLYEADDSYVGQYRYDSLHVTTLKADHQYQVVVTNNGHGGTAYFGLVRLGDLAGCDPLASTAWDADATHLAFVHGTELQCRTFGGSSGDRVRVQRSHPGANLEQAVLSSTGTVLCTNDWGADLSACGLSGSGPYRVLTWVNTAYAPDPPGTVDLWVSSYATTEGCATGPLATWNQPLPVAGTRSDRPSDCVVVTTGPAGSHLLRLENSSAQWRPNVELREVTGAYAGGIQSRLRTEQVTLKGAHPYRLIVTGDHDGWEPDYSLGVYRLADASDCEPLASTAWDAPGTELAFTSGTEVSCRQVSAGAGNRIRLTSEAASGFLVHDVYESGGDRVCSSDWGQSLDACALTGSGPWKVTSYFLTDYSGDRSTTVNLWVHNYASTAGCSTGTLASWRQPLPVTGERSDRPVDCVVITTAAAGAYLPRLENGSTQWTASAEIRESTGARVTTINSRSHQGLVMLKGSHQYRVLIGGDADGWGGDYEFGLFQLSGDDCRAPDSVGWDAGPTSASLSGPAAVACTAIPAQTGDSVRIASDSTSGVLSHLVLNAGGGEVCSATWGGSDEIDRCRLTGTGPWRLLSYYHLGYNDGPDLDPELWVNNYAINDGCSTTLDHTVSMAAPRLSFVRDGRHAVDCHLSSIARNSAVRIDLRNVTDHATWTLVDAHGSPECSGSAGPHSATCALDGPGPHRLLVEGADGAEYDAAVRRISDAVGCTAITGVAAGIPVQAGNLSTTQDLRCYKFPGGAGDRITVRADNPNVDGVRYPIEVYRPDGTYVGGKSTWDDEEGMQLDQTGEHIAIVALGSSTPGAFRFSSTCENPACGPDELTIASVSPNRPGAAAEVTLEIRGRSFTSGSQFALVRDGLRIEGATTSVSEDTRSVNVLFDLSGRSGTWTVVATNPDGTTASLPGGVVIAAPRSASVSATLVALPRFVAGRTQTVSIVVENAGNVDALGTPLIIEGFPAGTTFVPRFSMVSADTEDGPVVARGFDPERMVYTAADGTTGIPLYIGRIPAGSRTQYDIEVTVTAAENYSLGVLAGDCLFDSVPTAPRSVSPRATFSWGDGGCGDALVDTVVGAAGFIPGSECATFAAESAIAISRNIAQNAPPFSITPGPDMFWSAMSAVECAVGVTPIGPILDVFSTAKNLWNVGTKCFSGDEPQEITSVASLDPNEIVGPAGGGEQRAIRGDGTHRYAVYFENHKHATAPAQEVRITNQLDPDVYDLSTLRFSSVRFGTTNYTPPADSTAVDHLLDLGRADGMLVDIRASVTPQGLVTWHLAAQDPLTGNLPQDPLVGFLPPNVDGTEGQGVVFYDVELKAPASGDVVENSATIVFDLNEPITTNTWSNLIDGDPPTASTTSPGRQTTESIPVRWSSTDPTSGIAGVEVYVSVDGAPYELWRQGAAEGTATYSGNPGHRYAFSTVARDRAGNASLLPPMPHATTTVLGVIENTAKPKVSGVLRVGKTLAVSAGRWRPTAVRLRYQWFASGKRIGGGTAPRLKLTRAMKGRTISVTVTASRASYRTASVTVKVRGRVR